MSFLYSFKNFVKEFFEINNIKENVPRSTIFPHRTGIIIASGSIIGENCRIYQNVTIGRRNLRSTFDLPTIGNNVTIFAGACILGKIRVGDNAVIGANTVIVKDVKENQVIFNKEKEVLK